MSLGKGAYAETYGHASRPLTLQAQHAGAEEEAGDASRQAVPLTCFCEESRAPKV